MRCTVYNLADYNSALKRLSEPVEVVDHPKFFVGSGEMIFDDVRSGVTCDVFADCLSVIQLVLDRALNTSNNYQRNCSRTV